MQRFIVTNTLINLSMVHYLLCTCEVCECSYKHLCVRVCSSVEAREQQISPSIPFYLILLRQVVLMNMEFKFQLGWPPILLAPSPYPHASVTGMHRTTSSFLCGWGAGTKPRSSWLHNKYSSTEPSLQPIQPNIK